VTDFVNINCDDNILLDAGCYAPFQGPVWYIQSFVFTVKGGSSVAR